MVDGDALEMRFGETQRGFESPPLRSKRLANVKDGMYDYLQVRAYICAPPSI